ncbi:helix-turn-helix domain-containing protein [Terrabacter aerolatus]|uniref:HxlR family transcriptional regulator n=1 Tax=Terrabacter aerolatus TaxID=422442 RepID=A0A512D1U1_9MICO|nr:winged helix-turn-helix transcriptional regulator [Terrabacter aerolatus]GEO30426.1 HxlR family transcriptional regulator [Terrabacter aerolatus]
MPSISEPVVDEVDLGTAPTRLEPGTTNAIGRMLGLLGDEWTLLILQRALRGTTRYGQFLDELAISNAVLTSRLATMEREGVLRRVVYQDRPVRAEYVLTPRGRGLWPVTIAIWDWERQWVPGHAQTLPAMRHALCGQDFAPDLTCRVCRGAVPSSTVHAEWGPSGSWERSVPDSATRRRSDARADRSSAGLFPETMSIFGNRWSSALIGASLRGLTRFGDFVDALGAPPALVADRLRAFCDIGVLEARGRRGPGRVGRAEYHLTAKGHAFYPVVAVAIDWAQHWYAAEEGPALVQQHVPCEAPLGVALACDQCSADLHGSDIEIVPRSARRGAR